jgi:very-short-patch-repair endonuclease
MNLPPSLVCLAAGQDGIVTRRQALQHGLTVAALRHLLGRGGRWQFMVRGVYATFTGPFQERHLIRAGLLYAGPSAMVTGATACRAYGLRYVPASGRPELLVPERVQRARIPIVRIRRTRILPAARQVRSFPCAPPERAAVDACRDQLVLRQVRALLCEIVQRGLATPDRLVATLAGGHSAGSALPRRALEDVTAGCRSAPECELRELMSASRVLPEARWNRPLPDARGAGIVPDACLGEALLVIEVDSVEWHRFGDAPERTERRRARLAALGWTVMPLSPRRIREEPGAVLGEIEAAYLAGIARAGGSSEAV